MDVSPASVTRPGTRGGIARILGGGGLVTRLEAERARWFVWTPVAFGCGIAVYFALPTEPSLWMALAFPAMAVGLLMASSSTGAARLATMGLLAAALGFAAAKARTEVTRAPVLGTELRYADVQGIVELIEPRPTRGERLTIRVTNIARLEAARQPKRVRIRMRVKTEGLKPGDAVRLRATLRPPPLPALPGGYDFARTAWFQGLGATGYALVPAKIERPASDQTLAAALQRLRQSIGDRIRAAVPGETGAIAVSLITGERGGITDATNAAYRDSGLVHILSISGLHMVIMAGSVFAAVRLLLAAFPAIALRVPTKKYAAAAGILGAAGYLLVSGGSIPTIRAFIMITIMFVAVLLDRQAISMRNVALAALIVLAIRPESLLEAGFQMSFGAVVSLIAAYEAIRAASFDRDRPGWLRPLTMFFGGIVLSTVVASLAVAPIGVYHFHKSQQYALLANMLAVPICNLIIMPAALLALITMPLGLEKLPLVIMGAGIDAMTWTAIWVAALPGAVISVAAIPGASFAMIAAGGLWLTLWQTPWRALGLVAIGAGVLTAGSGTRPDILVGRGGDVAAIRGPDGRLAAHGGQAGSFELSRWLEHDGDARPTREALRSRAFRCDGAGCVGTTNGLRVAIARHASATSEDCVLSDILLAGPPRPRNCTAPLLVLDRWRIRDEGAHAIYLDPGTEGAKARVLRVETVAEHRGARPWSERPERPWARTPTAKSSTTAAERDLPDEDQ